MSNRDLAITRNIGSKPHQALSVTFALAAAIRLNGCMPTAGESKVLQDSSGQQEAAQTVNTASPKTPVENQAVREASSKFSNEGPEANSTSSKADEAGSSASGSKTGAKSFPETEKATKSSSTQPSSPKANAAASTKDASEGKAEKSEITEVLYPEELLTVPADYRTLCDQAGKIERLLCAGQWEYGLRRVLGQRG